MRVLTLALILVICVERGAAQTDDVKRFQEERDFFRAVVAAQRALFDLRYKDAIAAYEKYLKAWPASRFCAPAQVDIASLFLVNLKDADSARAMYEKAAVARHEAKLTQAASEIAKRWVARMTLPEIRKALHQSYLDNIEYPAKLDQLAKAGLIPAAKLISPWGEQYVYQAGKSPVVGDIEKQAYVLHPRQMKPKVESVADVLRQWRRANKKFVLWGAGTDKDGTPTALIEYAGLTPKPAREKRTVRQGESIGGAALVEATRAGAALATPDFLILVSQRVVDTKH